MYKKIFLSVCTFLAGASLALAQTGTSPLLSASLDKDLYEPTESVSLTVQVAASQLGNAQGKPLNFFRLDVGVRDREGKVCGYLFFSEPVWYSEVVKNFTFATLPESCVVGGLVIILHDRDNKALDSKELPARVKGQGSLFNLTPVQWQVAIGVVLAVAILAYLHKRHEEQTV